MIDNARKQQQITIILRMVVINSEAPVSQVFPPSIKEKRPAGANAPPQADAVTISTDQPSQASLLLDDAGQIMSFAEVKANNPEITPDQYLHLLASELKHYLGIAQYLKNNWEYWKDEENGFQNWQTDYWARPEEIIQMRNGANDMINGDCEDLAFFTQRLLQEQRTDAFVLLIPGHAVCVWLEEFEYGGKKLYSAYIIDTAYMESNNAIGRTKEEALANLMTPFFKGETNLEEIQIASIVENGAQLITTIPIEWLDHAPQIARLAKLNYMYISPQGQFADKNEIKREMLETVDLLLAERLPIELRYELLFLGYSLAEGEKKESYSKLAQEISQEERATTVGRFELLGIRYNDNPSFKTLLSR